MKAFTNHNPRDVAHAVTLITNARKENRSVAIAGGAGTANQYLAAGLLYELHLTLSPLVLGAGERLFDGVPALHVGPRRVAPPHGGTHARSCAHARGPRPCRHATSPRRPLARIHATR